MNNFLMVKKLMLAAVLSLGSQLALAADKVLIVVTSHQQLGNGGEKPVIGWAKSPIHTKNCCKPVLR